MKSSEDFWIYASIETIKKFAEPIGVPVKLPVIPKYAGKEAVKYETR